MNFVPRKMSPEKFNSNLYVTLQLCLFPFQGYILKQGLGCTIGDLAMGNNELPFSNILNFINLLYRIHWSESCRILRSSSLYDLRLRPNEQLHHGTITTISFTFRSDGLVEFVRRWWCDSWTGCICWFYHRILGVATINQCGARILCTIMWKSKSFCLLD